MSFLWPAFLVALIPVFTLAAFYMLLQRRRKVSAVRFSSLSLIYVAKPNNAWLKRYLPPALFLTGLTSLVIAIARPFAIIPLHSSKNSVILAIDVSTSMCATDIPPDRLSAAQDAARSFVDSQVQNMAIGIVAFSEFAALVQPPTRDRESLHDAIMDLDIGSGTAIGDAILKSLIAIAESDPEVLPVPWEMNNFSDSLPSDMPAVYAPHAIVLITDGANNVGKSPTFIAKQAAIRGIRIYALGVGSDPRARIGNCGRNGNANDATPQFSAAPDHATLAKIATITGGRYYPVTSIQELNEAFREIPSQLVVRHQSQEITPAFVVAGLVMLCGAWVFSLRWNPLM